MSFARVAVFVDGDNVGAVHASCILRQAARIGSTDLARVYLDATRNPGWCAAPGFRVFHAGTGKNAADLLLSIDAMEYALTSDASAFVLVSSDGDFLHLAQRLREGGRHVLGLGEAKAPEAFRAACSEFTVLNLGGDATDFDRKIRAIIAENSRQGQGMRIADLSARMRAAHATRISTYPERTWRAYLSARKHLFDLDPKGPEARVRFLKTGFCGSTE